MALYRLDIVDAIVFLTSLLSIALGTVSFIGFSRDKRKKLLFMSLAFFIFAIKGAIIIAGDFLLEEHTLDVIANLLDFAVLFFFFIAIIKK